jgi:hypothetical protein
MTPAELRSALAELNLSQGEFAKLVGISRASVWRSCSPDMGRVLIHPGGEGLEVHPTDRCD